MILGFETGWDTIPRPSEWFAVWITSITRSEETRKVNWAGGGARQRNSVTDCVVRKVVPLFCTGTCIIPHGH